MTDDQYRAACKLRDERDEITQALRVWLGNDLETIDRLAYLQAWNGDHATKLPTEHCPKEAFDAFRSACIKHMQLRLREIDDEFKKL